MKPPRLVAYLLLVVSMLMLAVPVIPHHHHADGLLCMKNDIAHGCCGGQADETEDHCCCDTGCITTHYFQQAPSTDHGWQHPAPAGILFFLPPRLILSLLPANTGFHRQAPIYIESLHGTSATRATGLRAPPFSLA